MWLFLHFLRMRIFLRNFDASVDAKGEIAQKLQKLYCAQIRRTECSRSSSASILRQIKLCAISTQNWRTLGRWKFISFVVQACPKEKWDFKASKNSTEVSILTWIILYYTNFPLTHDKKGIFGRLWKYILPILISATIYYFNSHLGHANNESRGKNAWKFVQKEQKCARKTLTKFKWVARLWKVLYHVSFGKEHQFLTTAYGIRNKF